MSVKNTRDQKIIRRKLRNAHKMALEPITTMFWQRVARQPLEEGQKVYTQLVPIVRAVRLVHGTPERNPKTGAIVKMHPVSSRVFTMIKKGD